MTHPEDDSLLDYDENFDTQVSEIPPSLKTQEEKKKGNYVAIHATGFRDFLLRPELLRAITDCGFEHPSEVQHETIPQAILGSDILCQAKSGMGKTAVFVLSTLQEMNLTDDLEESYTRVLVLCHARELAFQISHEFQRFSKYLPKITTAVFYGGVAIREDFEKLEKSKPVVVIGTPGRVLSLARSKHLDFGKLKHFILDECDRCLEKLDMRKDIQQIFLMTPRDKQVMMFSATMPQEMRSTCKKFMHDPHEISVDDDTKLTLHGLLQYYVHLEEKEKNRKLADVLDNLEFNQVVIFVNTVKRCNILNELLCQCKFPSIAIHSGLEQSERIQKYQQFKCFQKRILVTTDLLSRGIDVERVNIVINYDFPTSSDQYLHRVGRAGRFGTKGLAISFVSSEENKELLSDTQSRFEVKIPQLPERIEATAYINA